MRKHEMIPVGIQWPQFAHGVETWVLWRCACGCGRKRVEKLDGQWKASELGYEVDADG